MCASAETATGPCPAFSGKSKTEMILVQRLHYSNKIHPCTTEKKGSRVERGRAGKGGGGLKGRGRWRTAHTTHN